MSIDVAIRAEYDPEADAIYVTMRDSKVALTVNLGQDRLVDYDAEGLVVGYEFLGVSDNRGGSGGSSSGGNTDREASNGDA